MQQLNAFVKLSATNDEIALREVPLPDVSDGELLIRVKAVGVGIHDGYFFPSVVSYPYVIGIEASGVIERTGKSVTKYRPGERVMFISAMQPKGGTWAEYAVVDSGSPIIPIPDSMTFEEAAAIPVAANTVLRAFRSLDLQAGERLFIAGSSGAIGTLAIQIAVSRGYRVAASASAQNHQYMQSLGAEKVVDYHDRDWPAQILAWAPGGVDAAIAIQPNTARQSEAVVKTGGTIVAVSGDQFVPERGIAARQIAYEADVWAELDHLIEQLATDEIRLTIGHVYPFSQGLEALSKVQTRHARGKLVLTLAPSTGG